MKAHCTATYRIYDDRADFASKAEGIAVGMTVGSWTELPEAQKADMAKHLGQVLSVVPCESDIPGERYADITIAYPDVNYSRDLPALLVTMFGKLSMDGRIKLMDIEWSDTFKQAFPGPKFGLDGVRKLVDVHDRPLLMSIFKSVIGYDLPALAEQFRQQALGGVNIIKDDEILFENPLTPIERRVKACMEAADSVSQQTGQRLLYAVNLTGPTFKLRDQALRAIEAGANAFLFNVLAYGYDVLHALSSDPDISVPIAAHPAMAGSMYPSPHHGIAAQLLLGKLMRLAGADLVLFPSPYGSVTMPAEDTFAIRDALTQPDMALLRSFPVPSAGIHPGIVPLIIRDFGTDVIVNAGGGIHGHPLGTAAGGRAFVQAIDAVMQGKTLESRAADQEELRAAIQAWGVKQ
ncbi:2,3-diketo-5-methylthiopentyl-1-phosphate enolase [Paenibacillus thiaminolyticus]|uniref:2,3-diketo-5-methylthiopentyl-1-phosphate enolase n=1 Tax=Paenibacillus thiaminolyticus TaxID=49283 RepID=A0AAP9DRM0_PANTH|nr:2,3-diketo-5-methylthiopentyl-1-phosphate enolase [Paenibacillus thiaminolyticus]MCY9538665.1 2,3-diketo-5-methylthiopentyl-1-phosphate enolase [Paenibacillus thiaminolyticus]MCY9602414.1 2,3-diketo-5-methylthiopentyl-1-phosphate enolase [Paenibacillus thiaminolyticus]MCY9610886.1 2,3-diketo-5-methylthiopentyl-1-phosphate enolase [Paenibacillus thiaminolyticus]MCY9613317.1 2,3-diketo-5-methylthiopentyl-1-phosphate enolase [Paenibacillus thiaminolyticus]MCY9619491.1 2,3-diketo-5-methylthiope